MKLNFILIIFLILLGCENSPVPELKSNSDLLLGNWINLEYSDSIFTAERSTELDLNQYCIGFDSNNLFLENKNIGWCGTPPVTYGKYEGSWQLEDSVLTIETPYWGGTAEYTWKILEVNESDLKIWIISQDFEMSEE